MELKKIADFIVRSVKKFFVFSVVTLFLFFFLYSLKSLIGIDLFDGLSIEDLPGFICYLFGIQR